MLVLLSPSKTQDFSATDKVAKPTQPELLSESEVLMKELRTLSPDEIGDLMHISAKLSDLNYERYHAFHTPFTPANAKPAALAFKGDVYDGLDAETLSTAQLNYAQHCLRILSGLYGLLRPLDLIQAYRLEMKIPLRNPRGKDLYQFWGNRITDTLNAHLAQEKTDTIINLASHEYFKAVNTPKLKGKLVTVHFKEDKGGTLKIVALFAKRARGMMARHIVEHQIEDVHGITTFNEAGYIFKPQLSTQTELIFARKIATS